MTKTEFLNTLSTFATKFAAKIDSLFVRKVDGKSLSTNDYTTEEKTKLAGIAAGANKTVVDEALSSTGTNPVQGKAIQAALDGKADATHSHAFTDLTDKPTTLAGYGITDADAKGAADTALTSANSYTDQKIADLIDGAPTTMDTLKEVADAMAENKSVVEALDAAVGSKASAADLTAHTGDTDIHITSEERTKWNAAATANHSHKNLAILEATTASFTTEDKAKLDSLDVMEDITEEDIDGIVSGLFTA